MTQSLHILIAQINPLVGDIEGNTGIILQHLQQANDQKVDLIVFPELCITGYPPEDLLLRPHLYTRVNDALHTVIAATAPMSTAVILGFPQRVGADTYNQAVCLHKGHIIATHNKIHLPNYTVFDEKRYFTPGSDACVFTLKGFRLGLLICEDIWFPAPAQQAAAADAECLIVINASPYDRCKQKMRESTLEKRIKEIHRPILYVNCVGGQDELVFDGGSCAINEDGEIAAQAPFFETYNLTVSLNKTPKPHFQSQALTPALTEEASIYNALVLGLRDYIYKNHFPGALIGLSGGIDSALTLAIAVDAIGNKNVLGVLMPSRYTSAMSIEDAIAEAELLNISHEIISIEPMFHAFLNNLQASFQGKSMDSTEENIQARIRGVLLMALSNKHGSIVLTTGNKSEMSVGYATLYGDMAGGFAVLKDIPKTLVYRLARYRNSLNPVIPERVLTRAPSAELAENQKDQDSLPPYDILDAIIEFYVDKDTDAEAIIAQGFDRKTVLGIIKLIDRSEYKRRQAAPGVRISERAFGKDRRYPITSGYFKNT